VEEEVLGLEDLKNRIVPLAITTLQLDGSIEPLA